MSAFRARLRRLEDRGASAVEYGLMVAAIAALIAGTVFAFGRFVQAAFDKTCSSISASPVPSTTDCQGNPIGGGTTGGGTSGGSDPTSTDPAPASS